MKQFIKEYKWQKRCYLNGTKRYLLHKFGIMSSPSLHFGGVKTFKLADGERRSKVIKGVFFRLWHWRKKLEESR
ncbi:hypothetical protein [Sporosarcina psychrophila]|uniref:Thioredoxin n=1 Tax=Sporosarcina psychrophila TaxID=1476 RepID=A0ABV2KE81_SPOPS